MSNAFEHFNKFAAQAVDKGLTAAEVNAERLRLFKQVVLPAMQQKGHKTAGELQEASRVWNEHTDSTLRDLGFLNTQGESGKDALERRDMTRRGRAGGLDLAMGAAGSAANDIKVGLHRGTLKSLGFAARFANDLGENEQGSFLDNFANAMNEGAADQLQNVSQGYRDAMDGGVFGSGRGFGVAGLESIPNMLLPLGVGKVAASAAGALGAGAGIKAGVGGLAALTTGFTQNYGAVREGADQAMRESVTPDMLRAAEKSKPLFDKFEQEGYKSGLTGEELTNYAYEKTIDQLGEDKATNWGLIMTALEPIAMGASTILARSGGGKYLGQEVAERAMGIGAGGAAMRAAVQNEGKSGIRQALSLGSARADAGMVGRQMLEEGLQGGAESYAGQDAAAELGGTPVNWGEVATNTAAEGILGGIMGGGMQMASGNSPSRVAKQQLAQLRQQHQTEGQIFAQLATEAQAAQVAGDAKQLSGLMQEAEGQANAVRKIEQQMTKMGIPFQSILPQVDPTAAQPTVDPMAEQQPQSEPVDPQQAALDEAIAQSLASAGFGQPPQQPAATPAPAPADPFNDDLSAIGAPPASGLTGIAQRAQQQSVSAPIVDPRLDSTGVSALGEQGDSAFIDQYVANELSGSSNQTLARDAISSGVTSAQLIVLMKRAAEKLKETQQATTQAAPQAAPQATDNATPDMQDQAIQAPPSQQPEPATPPVQDGKVELTENGQSVTIQPTGLPRSQPSQQAQPLATNPADLAAQAEAMPRPDDARTATTLTPDNPTVTIQPDGTRTDPITAQPPVAPSVGEPVAQVQPEAEQAPSMQPNDIGRPSDGNPFATKRPAQAKLKKDSLADSHEVVQLGASAFVIRPKQVDAPAPTQKPAITPIKIENSGMGYSNPKFEAEILTPARQAIAEGNSLPYKNGIQMVVMDNQDDGGTVIALDKDGQLVGSLDFVNVEEEDGTRHNPQVHVMPKYRRQGVASEMYRLAEEQGAKIPAIDQEGQARTEEGQALRDSMDRKKKGLPPLPKPEPYQLKPVRIYRTKAGKVGAEVKESRNAQGRLTYSYMGEWGAGSVDADSMIELEAEWQSSKRGYTVEEVGVDSGSQPVSTPEPIETATKPSADDRPVLDGDSLVDNVRLALPSVVREVKQISGTKKQRLEMIKGRLQSLVYADFTPSDFERLFADDNVGQIIEEGYKTIHLDAAGKQALAEDERQLRALKVQSNVSKLFSDAEKENARIRQAEDEDAAKPETDTVLDQFADNKIFTADKVAAARERLRKKLNQLNSGIDPELLVDGMMIAGAYIESGTRKFSDYAQKMIGDMGDNIKPYLLSFWEGARNYPNLDTTGMTDSTESKRLFDDLNKTVTEEMKPVVGEKAKPVGRREKKTGKPADRTLRQDWGVDRIKGRTESNEFPNAKETDEGLKGGVKDAFIDDAKKYLQAAATELEQMGYVAHTSKKGKIHLDAVSANPSGVAGSGDVTMVLRHMETGANLYVSIGETALRGMTPHTKQGIAILFRASTVDGDRFASRDSMNQWSPIALTASELSKMLDQHVQRVAAKQTILPQIEDGLSKISKPVVVPEPQAEAAAPEGKPTKAEAYAQIRATAMDKGRQKFNDLAKDWYAQESGRAAVENAVRGSVYTNRLAIPYFADKEGLEQILASSFDDLILEAGGGKADLGTNKDIEQAKSRIADWEKHLEGAVGQDEKDYAAGKLLDAKQLLKALEYKLKLGAGATEQQAKAAQPDTVDFSNVEQFKAALSDAIKNADSTHPDYRQLSHLVKTNLAATGGLKSDQDRQSLYNRIMAIQKPVDAKPSLDAVKAQVADAITVQNTKTRMTQTFESGGNILALIDSLKKLTSSDDTKKAEQASSVLEWFGGSLENAMLQAQSKKDITRIDKIAAAIGMLNGQPPDTKPVHQDWRNSIATARQYANKLISEGVLQRPDVVNVWGAPKLTELVAAIDAALESVSAPVQTEPTATQDNTNEPTRDDANRPEPLADTLAEGVQGATGERDTTEGSRSQRETNPDGNGRASTPQRTRAVGSSTGTVYPDQASSGSGRVSNAVTRSDGSETTLEQAAKTDTNTAPQAPKPTKLKGQSAGNYVITDADAIGTGTVGQRLANNMAAIRLVRKLQAEGRYATQEEQAVLVKYVGWGGLANAFDGNAKQKQFRDANTELKALLSEQEFQEAWKSTRNAHYTATGVIDAMYDALSFFGFKGGRVLEPTVGTGNFVGRMPQAMSENSDWYASELDPITSAIAAQLYPDAQVLQATGFEDANFAYGRYDVAIGNPPFGDERITDTNKNRKHLSGMKIHNYVIAKSGMHLRAGGVMAMVVTHRFLDTKNDEARTELAKNFHFVGAVRLPNTAFAENANTEVTTDIVFFQKREQGDTTKTEADQLWLDTSATIKAPDGADIRINGYFAKNPQMMLGTPTLDGTMYGGARGAEFTLNPIEGMDLSVAIRDAIKTGMADYRDAMANSTNADAMAFAPPSMNRSDVAIGGYYFDEGKLYQRTDDDSLGNSAFRELTPDTQWTEKTKLGQTRYDRIVGQLNLRAATQEMISLEMQDAPKNILNDKRKALNAMYDAFVKEHGFISDNANRSLMDGDIGLESGLELSYTKAITAARAKAMGVDPKPAKAVKADILTRRVFEPRRTVESASSPEDAYLISIAERGRLDLEYMSGLLDMPISEITKKLSSAEKPLIFKDPKTEEWVQYDEYLSGNVKAKYQDAMDAGMDKNAAALKAVFPKDVEPKDLHITIRSTWIPPVYFEQFLEMLGAIRPKVSINPITGAMSIQTSGGSKETELSGEFKSSDYKIDEMLTELVNGRTLVARDYDPVAKRNHVNAQRTKELSAMAKNLKALFVDWMGGDSERMDTAAKAFNKRMNTHAERSFNGREMLVTYGANPSIELRNTQKDAAFRMIQSPAVLLDHVVGAGKTFTLITGIVERRRLGLSKKPMIAVPNHLVGQWAADFFKLYPAARVLAATPKDFQKQNRQKLFARIATGDFDAIILGHSSLKFLEMDKDAEERFISEEVAYIQKALDAARESDDKRSIKSLANTMAKKEQRIKALKDAPKDTVVTWGQLGVDYLAIDESHEFKNLEYSTGMQRVSGMNDPKGSQRAFDLYMKIRELRSNGGGVAFATGTPISNSLVEMYTILRYLNREELKARGQDVFDAWLSAYGEIDDRIELTATQQLKERKVLASFGNMPELLQLYREFADVITMDDLKRIHAEQVREKNERTGNTESEVFPVPKVKNGGRVLNKGNLSDAQQEYMDYLVARAQQIQKLGKEQDLKIDNLLWIQNDAKKMSLDIRLVDPSASDSADSKSSRASREIARIYQQSTPQKGTQLVFLDMSTPAKGADKEAAKIIKAALESTKLKDDRILKTMMDGESYQDQWRAILSRVDQITESEASDPESVAKLEDWRDKLDSDIEGVMTTADTGFSVYDDLKQKLIAQGVPENEIAFIHDYNTSDRKQELFGLVNAGVIRVLLGSTPKMGAGTNAQARLVALHHLDASMHNRPSDIEQREGRIIRQGNELYAADPDNFEVEIVAYSTERTFDAVQWQTLERKASMLEQFRSGERGMREPNGDAAGYAEFMAESTGNPAFKRKIELESQLDLLEANRRRYMARTSEAKRTVASYESSQSARRDELAVLEPAQVDEFVSAEFGGKQFANDYAKGLKQEVEAFTRELDQYEADMAVYRKDKELYDKATNAEQEEMTKPKSPKKPENHGIASKRMRAASQWSEFVGQFLEDADKKGSARAQVGDFELVLRSEATKSANGERQWELYLQKDGYTVDLVNSFEAKGKTPYLTKIFLAMQPRKLAAEVSDRVEDLNQRMQSGKTKYDLALKIADKQFDGQGALDQAKFEYEAVKKLVDEALTEDEARRGAMSNKYVSSDSNRFGSDVSDGQTDIRRSVAVWHGSPYHFDRFSLEHLGKGEGVQAFGWGLYFAGNRDVAEHYKKVLSRITYGLDSNRELTSFQVRRIANVLYPDVLDASLNGLTKKKGHSIDFIQGRIVGALNDDIPLSDVASLYKNYPESAAAHADLASRITKEGGGKLYRVRLSPNESDFLSLDQPLSEQKQHFDKLKPILDSLSDSDELVRYEEKLDAQIEGWTGSDLISALYEAAMDDLLPYDDSKVDDALSEGDFSKAVSMYLHSLGIAGNRFLAQGGTGGGKGHQNYVLFDDSAAEIIEAYNSKDTQPQRPANTGQTVEQVRDVLSERFGADVIAKLEADGKLEIVQSTGSLPTDAINSVMAWHGSPYNFTKFSLDHLSKGAGGQLYGYGLYFSNDRAVADFYRERLSFNKGEGKGKLYQVEMKPEDTDFIAWDGLLSQQPDHLKSLQPLRDSLEQSGLLKQYESALMNSFDNWIGGELYTVTKLAAQNNAIPNPSTEVQQAIKAGDFDRAASLYLRSIGVAGIKYQDIQEAMSKRDAFNYVLFDAAAVDIVETFYSKNNNGVEGHYRPSTGKTTLIADNLTPQTTIPTLLHEMGGHAGFQEIMRPETYKAILQQFGKMVEAGNPLAIRAKQRAESAEVGLLGQIDEYIPYLITEASLAQDKKGSAYQAVMRLIDRAVAAVRAWAFDKLGVRLKLNPNDIVALAERMVKQAANPKGTPPTPPKGRSNADARDSTNPSAKSLTDVRKQHKGKPTWMKAPNGKPTKLTERQWLQVRTPEFKAWFGDWQGDPANASKVVDANGEPMAVYHGTIGDFSVFDPTKGVAVWVAESPSIADRYGWSRQEDNNGEGSPSIMAIYMNARNVFHVDSHNSDGLPRLIGSVHEFFAPALAQSNNTDSSIGKQVMDLANQLDEIAKQKGVRLSNHSIHHLWFAPDLLFGDGGREKVRALLTTAGFDAIGFTEAGHMTFGALSPSQVKSVTGNTGDFDGSNPDIRFSRRDTEFDSAPVAPKKFSDRAERRVREELLQGYTVRKVSEFIKKNVSTELHMSLTTPEFKPVFDLIQERINHIAAESSHAIAAAPEILAQRESFGDFWNEVKIVGSKIKGGKYPQDVQAAAKVLFDGTLLDKKVYSDAELRAKGLTADQSKRYHEMRAAISTSLDQAAKSHMSKIAMIEDLFTGENIHRLHDQDLSVSAHRKELDSRLKAAIQGLDPLKQQDRQSIKRIKDALKKIGDVDNRLGQLKDEGYAPLMRFGNYDLRVTSKETGDTALYEMFETERDRNRARDALIESGVLGEKYEMTTKTKNPQEYKLFQDQGINPETFALFSKVAGLDTDQAYQAYLKLATAPQSALRRLIHRKGIAGFSENSERVLAAFVLSNARRSANMLYMQDIDSAVTRIEDGDVQERAQRLVDYIKNPVEEAAQLRSVLFLWHMGFDPRYGLLNLTQPYVQTLPELTRYVPAGRAAKLVGSSSVMAVKSMNDESAIPAEFQEDYKALKRKGLLEPQNIWALQGRERGRGASSSTWDVLLHASGMIAQLTETVNRRTAMLAALRTAKIMGAEKLKSEGFNSPYEFAASIIQSTQGVMNKGNRPRIARGLIGAPLMVFKSFGIQYVEQMIRLLNNPQYAGDRDKKRRALLLLLLTLFGLAGATGLPFMKDLIDVVETGMVASGNPVNLEREVQRLVGKEAAEAVLYGVANQFAVDMHGSLSSGDMLPATRVFHPDTGARGLLDVGGATGGFATRIADSAIMLSRGQYVDSLAHASPKIVKTGIQGYQIATTGEFRTQYGNKLTDGTSMDAAFKFFGFNPSGLARQGRTRMLEREDLAIRDSAKNQFRASLIEAYEESDTAKIREIRADIKQWNTDNPLYPVEIDYNRSIKPAIKRRNKTWQERTNVPSGMNWIKDLRPD